MQLGVEIIQCCAELRLWSVNLDDQRRNENQKKSIRMKTVNDNNYVGNVPLRNLEFCSSQNTVFLMRVN